MSELTPDPLTAGRIEPRELDQEMRSSFLGYAMHVIVSRALPDVRDGLKPNYDESRREPEVLPSRFPNLLVNGSSGIAVGMATNIPPHNLSEVIAGVVAMIDDPEVDVEGLSRHIKGPDFPTGGYIV